MITSYSESSYFDGYHFQHIAAFMEKNRLDNIERRAKKAMRNERRSGGRFLK